MTDHSTMVSLVADLAKMKSEQNTAAALDIYHPEVVLQSPGFGALAKGGKEVERQLNLFFALFPDYEVTLTQQAFNDEVLLATGVVSITLNSPTKACQRIQVPVFMEFHFLNEKISKEVFFLDASMVCRKSGVSADDLSEAIQALQSK
jgi:SnoaL-like domain